MKIYRVKKIRDFLPLLLLADEQESMIERYIGKATAYALDDGGVKAVIVVCDEGDGVLEIKNIAVKPQFRRKGYGRRLIEFVCEQYGDRYRTLQAGTGDSPLTVPFYERCGFERAFAVKNFFTDNYDHPIFECGVQLTDMIYFVKKLN